MMGVQAPPQGKLYYTNFNLDQRIVRIIPYVRSTSSLISTSSIRR